MGGNFVVYCKAIKRELNRRPMYEDRDEVNRREVRECDG
jgi:hypothetical protein